MANFINIGSAGFSKAERGPIDKNIVFDNVSDMNTFVSSSSGTAYAGQIISIADDQKALYKVIQTGSNYSTINLLDVSGGSDPIIPESKTEIFEINVLYTDIVTGFDGIFSGENNEFQTGISDDITYPWIFRMFYKDLCKYFGLIDVWDVPHTDYSSNPEYQTKILRISICKDNAFQLSSIIGYIIPNIYKSTVTIEENELPCWVLTYTYNNTLYTWKIADDSSITSGNPVYPFAVYKFDPIENSEDIINLNIIDLDTSTRSGIYTKSKIGSLTPEETDFSDYYTKSEVDSLISNAIDFSNYYTKSEVENYISQEISNISTGDNNLNYEIISQSDYDDENFIPDENKLYFIYNN